ncbi:serine hydrolase domain-containing protein [Bowmanella denitrificans]|uniref:serine hydrolase domain-containing protein n=1 Tax=Bowmanella denitrificans TaxID=366582 RepID=UPI000C9CD967|nr:serine hydrolase domain-containing protein [Bowmanella denitrificans]
MSKLFAALCFTMFISSCTQAPTTATQGVNSPAAPKLEKSALDNVLNRYKDSQHFMGSVAIYQSGKPVYSYASGYSNVENNTLSTPETRYRIGSITKSFTALLILMAYEEGKLTLDQTLDLFYPEIANANKITIAMLLNHSSGVKNYNSIPAMQTMMYSGVSKQELVSLISNFDSEFEPGTQERYSNSNYILLTFILERLYQATYAQLISEKIATPLGLKDTYYGQKIDVEKGEAYSYINENGYEKAIEADGSVMLGAGGVISTTLDLAKLFDALFAGNILKASTLDKMLAINYSFGLGVQKLTYGGKVSYGHRGHVDEFHSVVLHIPEQGMTLAILENGSFSELPDIVKDIYYAYFSMDEKASQALLNKFTGRFQEATDPEHIAEFKVKDDQLILVIGGEFEEPLLYTGGTDFLFDQSYSPAITFTFKDDGQSLIFKQEKVEVVMNRIQ